MMAFGGGWHTVPHILNLGAFIGVSGWRRDQATFTTGKESQAPYPVWIFYADVVPWLGVGDWVIQTISWCYEDHTWGTQLLVVLKNTQLNLINLISTTIHPSVSLWLRHSTKMIHIPPNKVLSLALEYLRRKYILKKTNHLSVALYTKVCTCFLSIVTWTSLYTLALVW